VFEISCFDDFCLIVWKPWILWMINVETCFKSLDIWFYMFVCCWEWIVGVVCEVWINLWKYEFLVKNEDDFWFMIKWWYKLMIKSVLIVPWCMLAVNKVYVTILGKLESKLRFLLNFWVLFRKETHFWVPLFCKGRPTSICLPWRVVQNCTCNSAHLRAYGVGSIHPYVFLLMCLTAVLPYKPTRTFFTWIKNWF